MLNDDLKFINHNSSFIILKGGEVMSQHPSLKSASKIVSKRNVLKRFERIDLLHARGKWKNGDRAYGLPKTKPE